MNQRVLCIWLPNWPSQRAAAEAWQAESEAAGQEASPLAAIGPRVCYANDPRRGRVVAAANALARERGVLPAMTLAQLTALCPEATWSEHDANADLEALLSFSEHLQQFSPVVGLESLGKSLWSGRSLHQPQAIFLDVTGTATWFGGEVGMAEAIRRECVQRRWLGCIGVAGTVGAAWAIANYAFRDRIAPAMLEVESGRRQPADAFWIQVLEAQADPVPFLARYPIESLRLEHDVVAKLHRLGIRSLGPLLRLPRASLTSRFGPELLTRIDQCFGERSEPIQAYHSGVPLEVEREWEHPIRDLESLGHGIRSAAEELCKRLEAQGHGALRIVCRMSLERQSLPVEEPGSEARHQAHVLSLSLFQATQDPVHIAWLLLGQLEWNPPRLGGDVVVRSVRIEANVTAPLKWRQVELFEDSPVHHRDTIARLIDSLSARLGRNQVVAPSMVRDPLPELQVRMRPLTGLRSDGRAQETQRKLSRPPRRDFAKEQSLEASPDDFLSRPSQLMRVPIPIEVSIGESGCPEAVTFKNRRWGIRNAAGPERIESGWWSGPSQRRDYYRVVLATGDGWWIYRDLKSGVWYLHGAFA